MNSRRTFVKQIGFGTAGLMLSPALFSLADAMPAFAPGALPRSTPEAQGVSSDVLNTLFDAMDSSDIEFHGVMILRNGFVISEGWWEPYGPQHRHSEYSLSKSFTSTAVGLAIYEGYFTLESPVTSFFPDMLPTTISPNLAAMKIKHLLTMTTGHNVDEHLRTNELPWVQSFLAAPITHEPGTFYLYNTSASYVLSAIVQKTTGKTVLEYLTPRIMEPLNIADADWEVSPQGINTGGYGLRIKTEDIAKFSQLYLNKGNWHGKQLIPASWVEAATKKEWDFTSNPFGGKTPKEQDDWQQGYGYQFWRTQHNGYRSDGLYGQFGIVLPDEKTIIAINEESFNTQKTLNYVWDILIPGLQKGMLPANGHAHEKLKATEAGLHVKFESMETTSPTAKTISGKKFILDGNTYGAKSITFNVTNNGCEITVGYDQGNRTVHFGMNSWEKAKNNIKTNNQLPFPMTNLPNVESPVAGNATWMDLNTLYLEIRPFETVNSDSITCKFDGNNVTLVLLNSVAKGKKQKDNRPAIIGHMA
jgi:CubicO group peptidase (beta-lactamase class C family)